jgi:hypothetical protein
MTRTIAVAIALATVLMSTAAYATSVSPRDDLQAPRGQDVQAPRDQDEIQAPRGQDPNAPRDRQDDVQAQAPRGSMVVSPR